MSKYKPKNRDIQWAREMMRVSKDGSLIRMPSDNLTYRKKGNAFVLVDGDEKHVTHRRTKVVFGKAGFVVRVEKEPRAEIILELRNIILSKGGFLIDFAGMVDASKIVTSPESN